MPNSPDQEKRDEILKRGTDVLIKDLGFARACKISGKSKTVLGRYASLSPEHSNRFIPVNVLLALELEASAPFVTQVLAELQNASLEIAKGT